MNGKLTVEDGDVYEPLDLVGRNMSALEATPTVKWSYDCSAGCASSSSTTDRAGERNVAITTTSTASSTISSRP